MLQTETKQRLSTIPLKPEEGRVNGLTKHLPTPTDTPTKDTPRQIPKRELSGPLTRARAYRLFACYLALAGSGTALSFSPVDASLKVFGNGLILPGSGFLALGGWWMLLTPIAWALFPVSVFVWFWCGNLLLPPIPYIGSAILAAHIGRPRDGSDLHSLAPLFSWGVVSALLFWWWNGLQRSAKEMEETRQKRNVYLDQKIKAETAVTDKTASMPKYLPGERELTPKEIAAMRYLINLTRQPLDSWKGFTWLEPFRETALRYQLYHIGYGLSMIQNNTCPNFHGELSRAQRTAIEKTLRPEVLYYWAWESLWGRFSLNWDPVDKENIMLTGWYQLALMMYTATTGDHRYNEPGSLVFRTTRWLSYSHSISTVMKSLISNWATSEFCLYACEPNWIYTLCNLYGMTGALIYDRVYNTKFVDSVLPKFTEMWNTEFMNPDGLVVPVRSSLIGVQLPVGGATVYGATSFQCSPLYPDLADQLWAIMQQEFIERDENGDITKIHLSGTDFIDPGNFSHSESCIGSKAFILMAAKEYGDLKLCDLLEAEIRRDAKTVSDGDGGSYIAGLSTFSNVVMNTGIFSGPRDFANSVRSGPPKYTFDGPLLAEAPYPDVVVAKAWSDGSYLDLVLYPGASDSVEVTLDLERLRPRESYSWDGQKRLTADAEGKARVKVHVAGRTQIIFRPHA